MLSITIFGLGLKALKALKALSPEDLKHIDKVIIGKDKNVQNDYSSELNQFCIQHQLKYEYRNQSTEIDSEILIAIGWRWLITKESQQKLIVFHDSILPRYRGFNPLVSALINGDTEIGVTALLGEEEFDSGDIVGLEKCSITYPIKIKEAIEMISNCYGSLLKKIVAEAIHKELTQVKQNEAEASFSLWRDFEDYYIDWTWPAEKIKRHIDAVGFPYQGARTIVEGVEYIINDASTIDDVLIENRSPGKVLFKREGCPVVVCGKGLLKIDNMFNPDTNEYHFPKKFRLRFK